MSSKQNCDSKYKCHGLAPCLVAFSVFTKCGPSRRPHLELFQKLFSECDLGSATKRICTFGFPPWLKSNKNQGFGNGFRQTHFHFRQWGDKWAPIANARGGIGPALLSNLAQVSIQTFTFEENKSLAPKLAISNFSLRNHSPFLDLRFQVRMHPRVASHSSAHLGACGPSV